MPPHPLNSFEIQNYYHNEPKFNGVYSRNNSPKIKDGTNIINLDKYESLGTHLLALYVDGNNRIYIQRTQAYNSVYIVWIFLYWIY